MARARSVLKKSVPLKSSDAQKKHSDAPKLELNLPEERSATFNQPPEPASPKLTAGSLNDSPWLDVGFTDALDSHALEALQLVTDPAARRRYSARLDIARAHDLLRVTSTVIKERGEFSSVLSIPGRF